MKSNITVLLSVMNISSELEYKKLLEDNKIKSNVIAVNQVQEKKDMVQIEKGEQKLYSYVEVGASKSRNRLLNILDSNIGAFADDDIMYVDDYEKIIQEEYEKNKKADMIIFFAETNNPNRERIKKIGDKKMNRLEVMKVRTYEITFKKDVIQKIGVKFDENFGPGGTFSKGEETIFVSDLLKRGVKIYGSKKKIANVRDEASTWFTGYHEKFLYDQGAVFYRIEPNLYKLLILQYVVRKHFLYKKNLTMKQAYKQMTLGAKKCKEMMAKSEKSEL